MRTTLYLDPNTLEKIHNDDFPTIRQILDEIHSRGDIDIALFSSTKDHRFYLNFIERHALYELIDGIQYTTNLEKRGVLREFDIIADDREEVYTQTTHIVLKESLLELVRWFVPDSKLLDDVWCLINSAWFINSMERTMETIEVRKILVPVIENGIGVDAHIPDYLEVEGIFVDLYTELKNDDSKTTAEKFGFTVNKDPSGKFHFSYKG